MRPSRYFPPGFYGLTMVALTGSTARTSSFLNIKKSHPNYSALQIPETETQYSRIGLILTLNKMM